MLTVMLCFGVLMSIDRGNRRGGGLAITPFAMLHRTRPDANGLLSQGESPGIGRIAQLVEQLTLNQRVLGSSPSASTIFQ